MTRRVITLRRAEADIRSIVHWLSKHSRAGARSWLDAYDRLVRRLSRSADACGGAAESFDTEFPIKQAFFRTPRGRTYRAIFLIAGDEVRILRVRGPGQAPVDPDELV